MFGLSLWGGSAAKKDEPKNAIVALQETLSMTEKRQAFLQKQATEQEGIAKQNINNKRLAMNALRQKKRYEDQVDKLEEQKRVVEEQLFAIQSANMQHETMLAMQKGASAMKSIHKGMNIEKVDKTMDEIREQMDISNEISEALSASRMGVNVEDEDELAAELERMQQEDLETKLLDGSRVPAAKLPTTAQKTTAVSVPAAATAEDEEDEAEFARLQAEFAM